MNQLGSQNERLASTLRDAREQIVQLKAEVDRLAQPPNTFGVYVGPAEDGTVEVISSGRKMRVALSPSIDVEELVEGQELMLNEAFNVVAARAFEQTGEIVILKEILDEGRRAWWSRTPTRSGSCTWPARCVTPRSGSRSATR